ncbi:hypothetical protein NECAME_17086 [Necator americanus]|uniref:Pyridoxal-dependent decarboxylase domain protein n=1 Tax=Necator americanus TaxID=51031 RepID=W2TRC2_NECAM|nr:hypothetical protein NECAME_17086 [Necator americanus]ETN84600.1 hypothetical protein NECAME_17086 [Necator americanus]
MLRYGTWLHVDAAYAGSTFIDPKYREVADGIENAHTINVNLRVVSDHRDWGLHLSRRFKALKVWFILRLCGVEGLRHYVNKN